MVSPTLLSPSTSVVASSVSKGTPLPKLSPASFTTIGEGSTYGLSTATVKRTTPAPLVGKASLSHHWRSVTDAALAGSSALQVAPPSVE